MDNWLLIIVGVIFLLCIAIGYARGFFKIGLSLLSSVLTILIMMYLSPYVADALVKYTPVDEMIEKKCVESFMPEVTGSIFEGKNLTGTPFANLDDDTLQNIADEDWKRIGITAEDILNIIGEIPKEQQVSLIENSGLPSFLKTCLLENNNTEIYEKLGVAQFPNYVAGYISRMVIKILSFLVTFVLAFVIVRALMAAVDIIGELPVLGFVNHCAGGVLGLGVALVIVWLLFLVLTLMYSSEIGEQCFDLIEKSQVLTGLYQLNPLLTNLISF